MVPQTIAPFGHIPMVHPWMIRTFWHIAKDSTTPNQLANWVRVPVVTSDLSEIRLSNQKIKKERKLDQGSQNFDKNLSIYVITFDSPLLSVKR